MMVPNNNLSVLPFYTTIEQQNARKWWIYGKVYPLFTPAGFLLPFQLMRKHRETIISLIVDDADEGYLDAQGVWKQDVTNGLWVEQYDVTGNKVYLQDVPAPYSGGVMAVAYGQTFSQVLGVFNPIIPQNESFTGEWELPSGTRMIRVQTVNEQAGAFEGKVYADSGILLPVSEFEIYTKDDQLIGDFSGRISELGFSIKSFGSYDVIVFPGELPILPQFDNGQYYAVLSDGEQTWYSEIFTVVNDISGYLKLEWWDNSDFVMDAGAIVYKEPAFKNVLYLCSDIAKPEYDYNEDVIERDGYTFPVKQVSEKRYRFSFLASEYLLDVLRFVRMSDNARITKDGQTWFNLDTFLISPDWEDNGDVAVVDAEFTTATVAKKLGVGYVHAQRGDFNNDYNNDFNITNM